MRQPIVRSVASNVPVRVVSAERPNTLGLGPRELNAVLDFLDAQDEGRADKRREFSRWPFRQVGVNVKFTHPGGSETSLRLAGRNLSRGGVSLLHNGYIHAGTRCVVELPRASAGVLSADGEVVRCQHRRGVLHEIGVKLRKPVNLRQFIASDESRELYAIESVDPVKLKGAVLVIEDGELDTRIFRHYTRETSLACELVSNSADAVAKLAARHDLYLINWDLPGFKGGEFIARLRAEQIQAPVIILTADPVSLMDEGVLETRSIGLLKKPFQQDELLRAIAERLLVTDAAPPRGAEPALEIAPNQLMEIASRLETAFQGGDLAATKQIALQLSGTAVTFGIKQVELVAGWAAELLAKAQNAEQAESAVRQLVAACREDARRLDASRAA